MVALAKPQLIDLPAMPEVSTKSNEWYTPSRYIEAARRVMGGIDLDPASCELANRTVKATRYYTQEENGLAQQWKAESVWLNPPYGLMHSLTYGTRFKGGGALPNEHSLQTMFVNKAISEYQLGNVKQVILLITANTTVRWFQPLWNYPMCTPYPKIGFLVPGLSEAQRQVFGNVFVYLGSNEQDFINEFSAFGPITKRIDTPRTKPAPLSLWEGGAS